MLHNDLLPILVCPTDHSPLGIADNSVNCPGQQGDRGEAGKEPRGTAVDQPLDGGLIRRDKTFLYPIVDNIPILLADEAIPLAQLL